MSFKPLNVSSPRKGILAGGNFITDFVKVIDSWPEQDTLASIRSQWMSNGGGPYNILKDLARLAPGLPLEACGLVGNDPNGEWILEDCRSAGIDVRQIHRTKTMSTSYTDAMTVASTGRRTFFHQRGANSFLAPGHFDFSNTSARIFVLGYLMLLDTLDRTDLDGMTGSARVLRMAREFGLITAVDCVSEPGSRFQEIVYSALQEADIFFINEYEIGQVIGRKVNVDRESMLSAALELAQASTRMEFQLVLHAAEGAVVAGGDGSWVTHPAVAFPPSEIVGATGAGDAFAAGYLLGIHEGKKVNECLRYAVCVAAMSLRDPTPSGGLRKLETCLELEDQYGYRHF